MLVLGYTGVLSVPLRVDGVGAVPCRVTRVAAAEARERKASSGTTLSIRTRPRVRPSSPRRPEVSLRADAPSTYGRSLRSRMAKMRVVNTLPAGCLPAPK